MMLISNWGLSFIIALIIHVFSFDRIEFIDQKLIQKPFPLKIK